MTHSGNGLKKPTISYAHKMVMNTPAGRLAIIETNASITQCYWTEQPVNVRNISTVLLTALEQLIDYFTGKHTVFDLPLAPSGTAFQQTVWEALLHIPYGETRSYQAIAQQMGCSNAARAVGLANAKNPLCILIPCHRVIRETGALGGYAGGITRKAALLALEQNNRANA